MRPYGRAGTDHPVGRGPSSNSSSSRSTTWSAARPPASRSRASRASARPGCSPSCAAGRRSAGHLVLSGSAAEFERDLPYGVWVDALDAYVASQELDAELADLAGVLPSLRPASRAGDERHRAHRAVRRLLELIAERKPLVLVLDDLHWSDAASVELIAALLRRGMAARVLLALGYRTGQAPASWAPRSRRRRDDLELGPLSEEECRRLAGGGPRTRHAAIFARAAATRSTRCSSPQPPSCPPRSSSGDRMARRRRRPAHGRGRARGGAGGADRGRAQPA